MNKEDSDLLGVISGSGLYELNALQIEQTWIAETPYGPASPIRRGKLNSRTVLFMNRHGANHDTPPHKINYRANLWALSEAGVKNLIAFNTVGSIHPYCAPGCFVVPDQVIDYTWGRDHTFADTLTERFNHIDFTFPFDSNLSAKLASCLEKVSLPHKIGGVYACTQGPRLETDAEIRRFANDGCDVVGMTLMPEAALARELSIPYASVSSVVNWAAGISDQVISLKDIKVIMQENDLKLQSLVMLL